jgi:hypothetical protein
MAGHSRSKNGVALLACIPAVHVSLVHDEAKTWMPATSAGMTWGLLNHATVPSPARRSTCPGSAPVWVASSTTTVPLTITVVRVPLGYWCGSA